MRISNTNFTAANRLQQSEPRSVIEIAFDADGTDLVYLTSHPVTGLSGANVITDCVVKISGTTQKLNPDKANSTIGAISFDVMDVGLTALQKAKLNAGYGLKGKRVRIYTGERRLDWADYEMVQTQIIADDVSYKDGVYSFSCADVQRSMRKDIFEPKKTAVRPGTIKPTSKSASGQWIGGTIPVYSVSGFEMVQHSATAGGDTDAPGQRVGYLKLSNGCIVRYTDIDTTNIAFTDLTWGVFNTAHLVEEIEATGTKPDDNPKVEELIYLDMPAPKAAYALLTGHLYGQPGEMLPDHWHLGIDPQWVRTSDFINIGPDLWNLDTDDAGVPAVIKGVEKTDGKKFIEEQILLMLGAYMPVYANGELGLRRMTVVHSRGSYVRELNDDVIVSYGELRHDQRAVVNQIVVSWNYDLQDKAYTRKNILIDEDSIAKHGEADPLEVKLRTLESGRHTYDTLKSRFDSLRDRYAGPPLRLSLTLAPWCNDLEVGDIVRVNLPAIKDYTGETTGDYLDRNFEVQQVKVDWISGKVDVELFGSSQVASALPPEETGAALADSWYRVGTEITPTNFPGGAVTVSGSGVTHIVHVGSTPGATDITLTGKDNINDVGCIYYVDGDLEIDAGAVVAITKNVQLRVRGFFQVNGTINGHGRGMSGGIDAPGLTVSHQFIGTSQAGDGIEFHAGGDMSSRVYTGNNRQVLQGVGWHSDAPMNAFTVDQSGTLRGTTTTLMGSPGPHGGAAVEIDDGVEVERVSGGEGGTSGAGLLIVSRGADIGTSALIDTSGHDGLGGSTMQADYRGYSDFYIRSGSGGGGCPGAVYFVIDGLNNNLPRPTAATNKAEYGLTQLGGANYLAGYGDDRTRKVVGRDLDSEFTGLTNALASINVGTELPANEYRQKRATRGSMSWYIGTDPQAPRRNAWQSTHRVIALSGYIAPVQDAPKYADQPAQIILTEATNTPPSAEANLSTIEVSVTAPADSGYAYSIVEYRKLGASGWFRVGPASPEATIVVPSDGATYEVRALSVGAGGGVASSGPVGTITVTDVISAPDPVLVDTIAPLTTVTSLQLEGGGTTFGGRDAKVVWADPNRNRLHFREYKVEILSGATLVRTETVTDPAYTYSYEKNAEDYKRIKGVVGAYRTFTVRVRVIGRVSTTAGQQESGTASITVSNPAPAAPGGIQFAPGFKIVTVAFNLPTDLDFERVSLHASTTSGFAISDANRVARGSSSPLIAQGLADSTTYYFRLVTHDSFGPGTVSSEFSVTTLVAAELDSLSPWATVTDVDRDFIEANVGAGAIPGTKIDKVTAGQIVTGTLAATEKISVEGQVEALAGPYAAVLGAKTIGAKVALLSFTASGTPIFCLYEDGTASFKGSVEITGGSGYSSLTDRPASLSAINSTEATKLSGIQAGATVGADWSTNVANKPTSLSGINSTEGNKLAGIAAGATVGAAWGTNLAGVPARFGDNDTPSAAGLYLTPTHLGYHNGNGAVSGWMSYIQNDGQFHFGNAATNYIDFNGSVLVIDTENLKVDAAGNVSVTGDITGSDITGSTITGGTIQTAESGERAVLNSSGSGRLSFSWANNGSIRELVSVGKTESNGERALIIGDYDFLGGAATFRSNLNSGVYTVEVMGNGLYVTCQHNNDRGLRSISYGTSAIAVSGEATNTGGVGGFFAGGPSGAAIRLYPESIGVSGAPTYTADMGSMVPGADGNLYYCSNNGSNWAQLSACKAWVKYEYTGGIYADHNVSSITHLGTGQTRVNFSHALPDTAYAAVPNCGQHNADARPSVYATTYLDIETRNTNNADLVNYTPITVAVFR